MVHRRLVSANLCSVPKSQLVESKTRTYHGPGGWAAHGRAAGRSGVRQDGTPMDRFAKEKTYPLAPWGIVDKMF